MGGGRKLLPSHGGCHAQARVLQGIVESAIDAGTRSGGVAVGGVCCSENEGRAFAITRLLVSKKDHELFGETEFQVRDLVHKIGARTIETAVNERKKGRTKGQA